MIGIAFAGGGLKGSYEVGAYFALKECGIKATGFCGTSIGAFNAAMIASGKDEELLKYWSNVNSGALLGLEEDFVNGIVKKRRGKAFYKSAISTVSEIIRNKGIETKHLKKVLGELIDEDAIRNSKNDFGLVTVKYRSKKPLQLYKEDMKEGSIRNYILASCFLPVFKTEELEDDEIFLDGGFFDNCPINMLLSKGYDTIYALKAKGIGIDRKIEENNAKIVVIEPSRTICSIFELNLDVVRENIILGYYDAMRVLKNYDGYKYSFKRKNDRYFEFIARKVDKKLLKRVSNFFKATSTKEAVIKATEYLMEKNKVKYYDLYSIYDEIKKVKKSKQKGFVYEFIKQIKFF